MTDAIPALASRFVALLCADRQDQAAYVDIAHEALTAGMSRDHVEEAFSRAAAAVFPSLRTSTRLVKVFREEPGRRV